MAILPPGAHELHQMQIQQPARRQRTTSAGPAGEILTQHRAALRCRTCDCWVQWLSQPDLDRLTDLVDHA